MNPACLPRRTGTLTNSGDIDTVLVCFTDLQGRLTGKRFTAASSSTVPRGNACLRFLLALDIDMEPVPGYKAASWAQGYGDFVLKPVMSTLRIPWLQRPRWCCATSRPIVRMPTFPIRPAPS